MAQLLFPSSPRQGTQYTGDNGIVYIFDGVKWIGHSLSQTSGSNSITNNGQIVQVDPSGNLVAPDYTLPATTGTFGQVLSWPSSGSTLVWETLAVGQTSWSVTPASGACPIYVELTTDYFQAYTQQSHLELDNTGSWKIGSNANGNGLFSNDNTATLYSNHGDVVIRVNDSNASFVFGANGDLVIPTNSTIADANNYLTTLNLDIQGAIKDVTGSTGSSGQVLTRDSGTGGVVWANATGGGGGFATTSTLVNGTYSVVLGSDGTLNLSQVPSVGAAVIQPNDTTFGIKLVSNGHVWTFGTDGNLVIPTGSTIKYENGSPVITGGSVSVVDGIAADTSTNVISISTVTTLIFSSDDTLYVTYTVGDIATTATQAGIILNGITTNHTQIANGGSGSPGTATISFPVDYQLWLHMVSVVAYVQDARGYTFYSDPVLFDMPYGSCLVEGTMITMADGSYKAVEDIEYSDYIRVWDFDLGEFSEARPIWIKRSQETHKRNRFTFSDGTVLETVGHHLFNKQAGAFTKFIEDTTPVGTVTVNEYGEEITLLSKETITTPTRYYNVWTQYHLNLFANGILTSNRFNNIYPIEDMKFVKDDRDLRPREEFVGIDNRYVYGLRLQEQPREYTTKYIQHYVHDKLEHQDVASTVMDKELQNDYY